VDKTESNFPAAAAIGDPVESLPIEVASVNGYLTSRRKRVVDILFSVIGLTAVIVLTPFVALVTVLTSGLPIFYRRDRLGLYGRQFSMAKFRTMANSENSTRQNLRTEQNDPRISQVGWILRKTYIDELPQFWNVLMGQMSVVGPRPEFPELAVELSQIRKKFPRRLAAKPGITGLAQVRYSYSFDNAHAAGRLPYDLEYIKRASLRFDIWIIIQTITKTVRLSGT